MAGLSISQFERRFRPSNLHGEYAVYPKKMHSTSTAWALVNYEPLS